MQKIFEKEVLEKDALNRIRWDPDLDPLDFSIQYLDLSRMKEVRFSEITLAGDFFSVGDSLVPMHRVRRILRRGEVVWEKRKV